ncbi:MAG: glutathione S-transferase family protein [Gammaproteobacteria bacterium]|nr:glutathione S-transferase family protein [Gammaproteobacteria bacterium]
MELTLVIGNKNYSSWSLRPWLLMKQAGIPFTELRVPLYHTPDWQKQVLKHSPSGLVPALHHGAIKIWDSLAICEYIAECFADKKLWPTEIGARAEARAVSAEMHAGFQALRQNMFTNIRRRMPQRGRTPDVARDIERISAIWNDCRRRHATDGPFLFGRFSIADAMYAPVALRFQTYVVSMQGLAEDYMHTLLALPAMQEWISAAYAETESIAHYEPAEN